jgi:release factor glutamine methyltransferase
MLMDEDSKRPNLPYNNDESTSSVTLGPREEYFQYEIKDKKFIIRLHPKVAKPNYASSFFVEHFPYCCEHKKLLDLCTGTGFIAIVLSGLYEISHLLAIDINPFAVSTAKENIAFNKPRGSYEILEGDLYQPIPGRIFDVITCLPPYVPTPQEIILRHSQSTNDFFYINTCGGENGRDVIDRVIRDAPKHLNKGACLAIVHSDYVGVSKTLENMETVGLKPNVDAQQRYPLGPLGQSRKKYIEQHLGFTFATDENNLPCQTLFLISGIKK